MAENPFMSAPPKNPFMDAPTVENQQGKAGLTKSEAAAQNLKSIPWGQFNDPRGAVVTLGSSAVATPVSGLAGIAGLVKGAIDPNDTAAEAGSRWQQATSDALTVDPINPASEQALEKIGQASEVAGKTLGAIPAAMVSFSPQEDLIAAEEFNRESTKAGQEKFNRIMETGVMKSAGEATLDATGSPLLATVVETAPLAVASILGTKGAIKKGPDKPAVPTIEELKAESRALYKAVDEAGVKISDDSFRAAVADIKKDAMSAGARQSLTPKTWAALKELENDAKAGNLTLAKAEELRRVIKKAQNASDPADLASASRALSRWDKYIESLGNKDLSTKSGPEVAGYLKSARSLWSRSRKAEVIDDLIDTAQINAGMFSGSGYENALRTQFRQLARNKKRMRMFTADEQAAIKKVANGGPMDNILRYAGKLAPTGVVSAGAGVAAGGIAAGPIGAVAVPALGGIARKLSTHRTIKNAEKTSELMRRGTT